MPTGASLLKKVSAVLAKTHVTSRVVKFRTVLSRDGNALLGIGVTRANLDEDIVPQPVVEFISPEEVAFGGSLLQVGDYRMLFDGNVLESSLETCDILYGNDLLKIVSHNPIVYGGVVVGWQVLARTVKAQ